MLSEFTGAADELAGAFGVNPHGIEGLKDAIVRAADTSPAEARRRMRAMRKRLFEHDVARWATDFLDILSRVPGNTDGLSETGVAGGFADARTAYRPADTPHVRQLAHAREAE